jgi:glycerol kinase
MSGILALDQGTTSSRAIVFTGDGSVAALAQREFRQIYPQPGWVEHDATEIASTQIAVAAEAIAKVPQLAIGAIGITNQRETTVLWDRRTGQPVANAIVWQDRRTATMCEELRAAGHEKLFRERTGLVLDPYFSGTKIRWLLDHVGGSNLAFGTVDSWLIWKLTNGRMHVTDVTNASRTLLFNIHTGEWDDELLAILRIPREILPAVVPSSGEIGVTAEGLPIPAGIPIRGVAGDQQAALFGQRCIEPGMAKNTYGTGCFIVMNTGERAVESKHGLLATSACNGQYALEGSIFTTGAAVQWLRDGLGIIRNASEIEALASSVPDNGGVTFVPAFAGLGAPHWDPHARGAILGLTRGTTAAHIARAALESIALQTADVLDAMRADSDLEVAELRVDGAGSTNDLLMQMQADIAQVRVARAAVSETTALGAAYLAGISLAGWKYDRVFQPMQDTSLLRAQWRQTLLKVTKT